METLTHGFAAEAGEAIPSSTVTGCGTQRRAAELRVLGAREKSVFLITMGEPT